jgi:fumarate reductase subunit C
MTHPPTYSDYQPRLFRSRVSTYWWLQSWYYLGFILREVSSVFVAWFVIFFLMLVHAVSQGPSAYEQFLAWAAHPVMIGVNLVSLFFVVFHSATWFNLAPKAMVARMGGKRVPPAAIAVSNYAAWLVVSLLVAWLLLGGRP